MVDRIAADADSRRAAAVQGKPIEEAVGADALLRLVPPRIGCPEVDCVLGHEEGPRLRTEHPRGGAVELRRREVADRHRVERLDVDPAAVLHRRRHVQAPRGSDAPERRLLASRTAPRPHRRQVVQRRGEIEAERGVEDEPAADQA